MSDRRLNHDPNRNGRALTGRGVLLWFCAFFGVVFAVNGVFLAKALSTYSGVVSQEPYVKGLQYNARIAAEARQNKLGWHDEVALGRDGHVELLVTDAAGKPVTGLAVIGTIGRPATSVLDHQARLAEQAPGRYVASLGALAAGTWQVDIKAAHDSAAAEPDYRLRRRLWLKP